MLFNVSKGKFFDNKGGIFEGDYYEGSLNGQGK